MNCKRTLSIAVLAAAFVLEAGAAEQDGAQDTRAKVAMCQGCHGLEGYRVAFPEVYSVPKLGGQYQAYIIKALQDYKSGARSNPNMRAITATMSESDMAALAAYYGKADTKTAATK